MLHVWNISIDIYPINDPNVGEYNIRGAYGMEKVGGNHMLDIRT